MSAWLASFATAVMAIALSVVIICYDPALFVLAIVVSVVTFFLRFTLFDGP